MNLATSDHNPFLEKLGANARLVETGLAALLTKVPHNGEIARPERLLNAMRHGVLNGGKRLRPFLVIEVASMFGSNNDGVIRAACALECIHCYSLIHDDLPAMDDDDLRRGQPTVHVTFDEATAILAGDGLLTLAFDILADEATHQDPAIRSALVLGLARNAGVGGMVGGQVLDIESEGKERSEAEIRQMQAMKTGALLRFACEAGAVLADSSQQDRERMIRFGTIIGLAFQLADDLLDVTASTEQLGKTAGKDIEARKATLVDLYGIEETRAKLSELIKQAEEELAPFGDKADILIRAARYIAERKS